MGRSKNTCRKIFTLKFSFLAQLESGIIYLQNSFLWFIILMSLNLELISSCRLLVFLLLFLASPCSAVAVRSCVRSMPTIHIYKYIYIYIYIYKIYIHIIYILYIYNINNIYVHIFVYVF